jgi:hypothetical protein
MTPERIAALVARWVRFYTRDLPLPVAGRRVDEVDADLHDHIAHDRAIGSSDRRIALSILSRMLRGVSADVSWRDQQAKASRRRSTAGGPMDSYKTAYRFAIGLALATGLFLVWGVAAMGVIGAEGDPFDSLYFGVLAVGLVGGLIARFQPRGMVRALLAMAVAQALVTVIALMVGKQESPVSSVAEIVGLNGFYIALFLGSAWLFSRAARLDPRGYDGIG